MEAMDFPLLGQQEADQVSTLDPFWWEHFPAHQPNASPTLEEFQSIAGVYSLDYP